MEQMLTHSRISSCTGHKKSWGQRTNSGYEDGQEITVPLTLGKIQNEQAPLEQLPQLPFSQEQPFGVIFSVTCPSDGLKVLAGGV